MAANITTATELFHRFHTCELHVKRGKIASCLISFKQIIESLSAVSFTDKEKKEFNESVEGFLKNLSGHNKFKEIFGEVSFADTDLRTNLEFVRSMIVAQEQEIVQRIEKDEEVAEAKRAEDGNNEQKKKEGLLLKLDEAIKLIDEDRLPEASNIISGSDEIKDGVIQHFNDQGIHLREAKDFAAAVKSYSAAISISIEDENLHYNLGRVFFEHGDLGKAIECLDTAMGINPDFHEGKLFHDYLLKLKQSQNTANKADSPKKVGWFFQRLFLFQRLFSFQKNS